MNARTRVAACCIAALAACFATAAAAQLKIKQGMLNVPALSPLWLLPDEAKKHGIEIESVMFQRFADARTALASGDIQLTAFGPQDISLALGAGNKSLVFSLQLRSTSGTLTNEEADAVRDRIVAVLAERVGAALRA